MRKSSRQFLRRENKNRRATNAHATDESFVEDRSSTRAIVPSSVPLCPGLPPKSKCSICSCHGTKDSPLIAACCCDNRLLHARCFRKELFTTWSRMRAEGKSMPLTTFLDCPICGSAYRFKYQNRILRFVMEKVPERLWPALIGLLYVIAFLLLCELNEQASWVPPQFAIPDGRFKYFWGGVDGLSALSTLFKVRGRGSLLYLSFFLRVPDDAGGYLSSVLVSIIVVGLVAFNVVNLFRDLYMYVLWISIQCTTPLSFVESSLQRHRPVRTENVKRSRGRKLQIADTSVLEASAASASPTEDQQVHMEDAISPVSNPNDSIGDTMNEPLAKEAEEFNVRTGHPKKLAPEIEPGTSRTRSASDTDDSIVSPASRQCDCICCLDAPARFVAENCGHLVTCKVCKKRLIYKQLVQVHQAGLPKMRDLGQDMMQGVHVPCPICRTHGELVYVHHFKGEVFFP